MSKCNFSIPFTSSAMELIGKTKTAIENNGGLFEGDEYNGRFEVKVMGTIAGTYTIEGNEIKIDIQEKPLFLGCGQLESFMRGSMNG